MGLIREVPGVLEPKRMQRWIEVLSADDELELPKVEFLTGIINEQKIGAFLKPFRKRDKEIDMNIEQQGKFRKIALGDSVSDWRGVTKENAMRLCEVIAANPELVEGFPKEGAEFNPDDLAFIAEHMNGIFFNGWLDQALRLEEFAKEQMKQRKNS